MISRALTILALLLGRPPVATMVLRAQDDHGSQEIVLESDLRISQSAQMTCKDWYELGHSLNDAAKYQQALDTMKEYIYSCHTPWIKPAFTPLTVAVQYVNLDNNRWKEYREWLKSVVYLNQVDEAYYCGVVRSLMSTFQYMDPKRGIDYNGHISMIDYVVSTGKCPEDSNFFNDARLSLRIAQVQNYHDTVQSPLESTLDTALVSLHDIGLGILYGPSSAQRDPVRIEYSVQAVLGVNPTTGSTELKLDVSTGTSLSIGLYDMLGNQQLNLGMRWFERGSHAVSINVGYLPSGSYYLRLATSLGEVQTLKLVKQ